MTPQPDLTPDLGSGPALEQALLATAFRLLLADGGPVSPARLAEALAGDPERVARTLARLDQHGRLRRTSGGAVTGSHGLSVTPTSHELLLEREQGGERRYWTWCAWDAVGILAALGASGRVRSNSPSAGQPIEIDFADGWPADASPELAVFFADTDCRDSVIDQWCPLVNFYEHAEAARAWAAEHGVRGTPVPLAEATRLGKEASSAGARMRPSTLVATDGDSADSPLAAERIALNSCSWGASLSR
jgi:alkylmercury lyase